MLRLSPPALTAGLCRPFGAGFPFRSVVPGFRPCTAYGCRLRADSKFMIFFITNKISNSFFAKTRVSALPRKRGNYVCISKGILPGGESGLGFTKLFCFFTISLSLILVSACALSVFLVMSAIFLRQIARYPPHQDDGTASKIHLK